MAAPSTDSIFNHPNNLSVDLERVKTRSTDDLLDYLKLLLLIEQELLSVMPETEGHGKNKSGSDKRDKSEEKDESDEGENESQRDSINTEEVNIITLLQHRIALLQNRK